MKKKLFYAIVWDDRLTLALSVFVVISLGWKDAWEVVVLFGNFSIFAHIIMFALERKEKK